MGFHNLVNTTYFSEAANSYRRNGGKYTLAPKGSRDYYDFWDTQETRCREGYSVGDLWIPGRYYFYLNFTPIWKVPDSIALKAYEEARNYKGIITQKTASKILDFPRFSEMQYEWWNFKHIAWFGGSFMGVQSPGGKHISCAKTRGAGFSYMEAADGVYNYNFINGSKSYYFASLEEYLIKDGILNKVNDSLEWINSQCDYWKQNRQKKNTLMHQRASYLDSFGEEHGSFSEIIGTIIDNPNKTRGKRGRKITFEESGSFRNLAAALEIALGSLRDGDFYVGQASVFGTGGEEGPSIEGLEDIFYNPKAWDMLAFDNIWENGAMDTCGYFVPCFRANFVYMDEDGNCDTELAIKSDKVERDKKKESKDPKALDRRKAEYPQRPSELFQRLTNNGFNTAEIEKQIRRIQTSKAIQSLIRYGDLENSTTSNALGGVEFIIKTKEQAKPIEEYPHKQDQDLTGSFTICERPYVDQTGKVPPGMYQIVFDAYYKEDAEDRTSLFAFYVLKQDNNIDNTFAGLPVAWWAGRPKKLSDCYTLLFNAAKYYNCTVQGEISGGGQGVVDYAKVEFEPEMLHNKEVASKQKNKAYLMNMSTDRKRLGISYLEDWHIEQRGLEENGNPILNIHRIYDVMLLKEMKKFGSLNADRISAMLIGMFMLKENITRKIETKRENNEFYNRTLFSASDEDNESLEYTEYS
jgi:hypothetical protein